jgi:uncharacterized protein (DUF2147 family)
MFHMRLTVFAAASLLAGVPSAHAQSAEGTWAGETGGQIKVFNCGSGVCAQITASPDPSATDKNNPDLSLRSRSLIGLTFMDGARKMDKNTWKGKVYNVEDGRTYSGSLTLVNDQQIEVKGCLFGGIICRGRLYTRVELSR